MKIEDIKLLEKDLTQFDLLASNPPKRLVWANDLDKAIESLYSMFEQITRLEHALNLTGERRREETNEQFAALIADMVKAGDPISARDVGTALGVCRVLLDDALTRAETAERQVLNLTIHGEAVQDADDAFRARLTALAERYERMARVALWASTRKHFRRRAAELHAALEASNER